MLTKRGILGQFTNDELLGTADSAGVEIHDPREEGGLLAMRGRQNTRRLAYAFGLWPCAVSLALGCTETRPSRSPTPEPVGGPVPSHAVATSSAPTPGAAPSSVNAAAAAEIILDDPRTNARDARVVDEIDKAEEAGILRKLFPKYLTDEDNCSGVADDLEGARRRGDIVPTVRAKASGAFTYARRTQTLYLVFVGECGASHADNFGSTMIAVVQDGAIVGRAVTGGSSIAGIFDLDGDGRQEVLLGSGYTNMGITVSSASLVRVETTSIHTVIDFGQVYEDNCASVEEMKKQEFSVIYATPGSPPTFRKQPMTRPCE